MLHDACILYVCLADAYVFPQPGESATRGKVSLRGQNVTLKMDTVYEVLSYFRVRFCNRSIPNTCYYCYNTTCKWGELSCHTDGDHVFCQFNTSQPGLYQFQIYTSKYPCYLDIGDQIDVTDDSSSSTHDHHVPLGYFVGIGVIVGVIGLTLLLTVTVLTYFIQKRCRTVQARLEHGKLFNL